MEHLDEMIENITRTINHYFNPAGGKTVTFVLMVDNGKEVRYTSNQFKPCDKCHIPTLCNAEKHCDRQFNGYR